MTLGNRIGYLRQAAKLSQKELGKKTGLARNTIWQYENDKRMPSIENAQRLADALGVSLDALMHGGVVVNQTHLGLKWGEFFQDQAQRSERIERLLRSDFDFELFLIGILQRFSLMDEEERFSQKAIIRQLLEGDCNLKVLSNIDIIVGCMSEMTDEGTDKVAEYVSDMGSIAKYHKKNQKPLLSEKENDSPDE